MPFTVDEFANMKFDTVEQYNTYIKTRRDIQKKLESSSTELTRVENIGLIKRESITIEQIEQWILNYIKTYQ